MITVCPLSSGREKIAIPNLPPDASTRRASANAAAGLAAN
jgi:hypothetical protein